MDRFYEVMFIVRPDVEDADLDKLIAGFEADDRQWRRHTALDRKARTPQARLHRPQVQRRQLRAAHHRRRWQAGRELERRLRVSEPVIKFITVRMDEEQKRIDKIKAIRATRKKVSAQPVAAPSHVEAAPHAEAAAEACCRSGQRITFAAREHRIQD